MKTGVFSVDCSESLAPQIDKNEHQVCDLVRITPTWEVTPGKVFGIRLLRPLKSCRPEIAHEFMTVRLLKLWLRQTLTTIITP